MSGTEETKRASEQKGARDVVTEKRGNRGRKGQGLVGNVYKGPPDPDNRVGMDCGRRGGQGRAMGGKWGHLSLNNSKNIF